MLTAPSFVFKKTRFDVMNRVIRPLFDKRQVGHSFSCRYEGSSNIDYFASCDPITFILYAVRGCVMAKTCYYVKSQTSQNTSGIIYVKASFEGLGDR